MREVEALLQKIESSFPAERFFGPVTGGCACDECSALTNSFRHEAWNTLTDQVMDERFGSLPLLSPEAFATFLPAWLTRSLRDLDAKDQKFREWTLYQLALYHEDEDGPDDFTRITQRLRRDSEQLTPEQVELVGDFLRLIRERACISEFDDESIGRSLELVWER